MWYGLYVNVECDSQPSPTIEDVVAGNARAASGRCRCTKNGKSVTLTDSMCRAARSGSFAQTTAADGTGVITVRGVAEVPYSFLLSNPSEQICFDGAIPAAQDRYYLYLVAEDVAPTFSGLSNTCSADSIPSSFSSDACTGVVELACEQMRLAADEVNR